MALAVVGAFAGTARAHLGGSLAYATFVHPAPPVESALGDGGVRFSFAPDGADQRARIEWTDGDVDPTGRFRFYYLDHGVPSAIAVEALEALAHPVITTDGRAADVYVSCACDEDAGVTCEGLPGRWCDNAFDWDTSAVPDGSYYVVAVNHDPPYRVFSTSRAPVRVSHGGARPPPAVAVVRPGAFAVSDGAYRVAVLVTGEGPLTLDLARGRNTPDGALAKATPIANGLPATLGADGAVSFEWETASVPDGAWFVRATVRDALGRSASSDSPGALSVVHGAPPDGPPPDAAGPVDAAAGPAPVGSCACALSRRSGAGTGPGRALPIVGALALAIAATVRRRARRRGAALHAAAAAAPPH